MAKQSTKIAHKFWLINPERAIFLGQPRKDLEIDQPDPTGFLPRTMIKNGPFPNNGLADVSLLLEELFTSGKEIHPFNFEFTNLYDENKYMKMDKLVKSDSYRDLFTLFTYIKRGQH